jgi:hypothetical protein
MDRLFRAVLRNVVDCALPFLNHDFEGWRSARRLRSEHSLFVHDMADDGTDNRFSLSHAIVDFRPFLPSSVHDLGSGLVAALHGLAQFLLGCRVRCEKVRNSFARSTAESWRVLLITGMNISRGRSSSGVPAGINAGHLSLK